MFGMNFYRYWINPRNVFSSLAFSGGFISFTALIVLDLVLNHLSLEHGQHTELRLA